jgi:Protein of unknown function (DUF1566)
MEMPQAVIFGPFFATMTLTFVVWIYMYVRRISFVSFLAALNGAGFAGQYDWRLPTIAELLSITQPTYPLCMTPPCIDATFGPTRSEGYWSSSTYQPGPVNAWSVHFSDGGLGPNVKLGSSACCNYARAVRGGF